MGYQIRYMHAVSVGEQITDSELVDLEISPFILQVFFHFCMLS